MPVHRITTFRLRYDLDKFYELVSRPRDFFSLLPVPLEFKAFRGSDAIVYLNAFGFKGDAVFSFAVARRENRVTLESSMIGELILGFFRPPRMDLSFRVDATRIEGGIEVTFEVYVKTSYFRERAISRETEELVRKIPEIFSEVSRRVSAEPGVGLPREAVRPPEPAAVPAAPPAPPAEAAVRATAEAEVKKREELVTPPVAPAPGEKEAVEVGLSDRFSALLEDPLTLYRLTASGKPVSTHRAKYSPQLLETLSRISSENRAPVYAILRGEKSTARLLLDGSKIVGVLLESEGRTLKGKEAVEVLRASGEEYLCAVFTVDRELLGSSK